MLDWNVVIGVNEGGDQVAQNVMERFGPVQRSRIGNVLTLKVEDPGAFVAQIATLFNTEPNARDAIGRRQ